MKAERLERNANTKRLQKLTTLAHYQHIHANVQVSVQIYDPKTKLYQHYNSNLQDPNFPAPYKKMVIVPPRFPFNSANHGQVTMWWPPIELATPESVDYHAQVKKENEKKRSRRPHDGTVDRESDGETPRRLPLPLMYDEITPQQFARLRPTTAPTAAPSSVSTSLGSVTSSEPVPWFQTIPRPLPVHLPATTASSEVQTAPVSESKAQAQPTAHLQPTARPQPPRLLPVATLQPDPYPHPAAPRPLSHRLDAVVSRHQALSRAVAEDCHRENNISVFKQTAGPFL